ncbi:MAG: ion channel protein Tsx [Oleiphilaceae bacterium]|nr:ion channel protein Tsx [Oleiphilaceae bacterium]
MKQLKTLASAAALSAAVVAAPAQAEQFWADNSITVLHSADYFNVGYNFGAPNKTQEMTVMTIEHASGHDWGDAFFFVDRLNGKGSASSFNETYGELSPRFSLSNLAGSDLSVGPIKDVLLATTYEFSSNSTGFSQDNYLYGVGLSWDLPGFAFFGTNVFYADNENNKDDVQLTVTYGVPFAVAGVDFMFDGYFDWSSAEADHASDFHFNPQLRADVGKFMGITKSKLEVGIEYSYWSNKFGVKSDENESAVSGLIKYHL